MSGRARRRAATALRCCALLLLGPCACSVGQGSGFVRSNKLIVSDCYEG
ncbi:MAG: hypothetical protein RL033_4914, partial [Pseudomonadota bacterium]